MKLFCFVKILVVSGYLSQTVLSQKEFSLARYSSTAIYANNSVININLVGEGFEGVQITDGGALECHTDDTTCCRGRDNLNGTGRGEWYYPNGTVVPPPIGDISQFYRTRGHMVIRLNRVAVQTLSLLTGAYRCEIPCAGGLTITRFITLASEGRCTDLHDIPNGAIIYTPPRAVSAGLPVGQRFTGTIATYSCSPGYQLVGGSSMRACGPDWTWSGTEPVCASTGCSPLPSPANGQVVIFGSTATYTCDTGYTLSGSQSRTCGADGNWTSSEPSCETVDCGPLTDPDNGQVILSTTTFGSTATYMCGTGYILSDTQQRTCGADGNWTSSEPLCEVVTCAPLLHPTNGGVDTSSGTTFGSVATFSCNTGYRLSHQQVVVCKSDGVWSPASPSCLIINCGPLADPENGQVSTLNGTTFGRIATYKCYREASSRTCGADGNWTSVQPNCQEFSTSTESRNTATENSESRNTATENCGVVGGVTAAVLITVFLVITAFLLGYIVHPQLHKEEKPVELQQYETVGGGSAPQYEVTERAGVEYEEIDRLRETREQPHPPTGDYELTQCPAYGPVNRDT